MPDQSSYPDEWKAPADRPTEPGDAKQEAITEALAAAKDKAYRESGAYDVDNLYPAHWNLGGTA